MTIIPALISSWAQWILSNPRISWLESFRWAKLIRLKPPFKTISKVLRPPSLDPFIFQMHFKIHHIQCPFLDFFFSLSACILTVLSWFHYYFKPKIIIKLLKAFVLIIKKRLFVMCNLFDIFYSYWLLCTGWIDLQTKKKMCTTVYILCFG